MQSKKILISFFLLFTALLLVNTSFAANRNSTRLSHFIAAHKHNHSQSTGKDFLLASDIQTERTNDEYKKRLALFRLSAGKTLLVNPLDEDYLFASLFLSAQSAAQHYQLLSCRLSHIYPFHFFW